MTRRPTVYGLDIETDTRTNAIDPQVARVRAVALSCEGSDEVFEGEEEDLIAGLDDRLAALPPGIIATWNGAAFDLPFLADRAAVCGVPIGLRLRHDPRLGARRAPLPGHPGAYRAAWYRHGHIDAYRVYRGDTAASPRLPAGLRCLARLAGLRVVEVERDLATELEREAVHAYAAGDARLARVLTERRWPGAKSHVDRRVPDTGPWVPPWFRPEPEVEVEAPAYVTVAAGRRDEAFVLAGPSHGMRVGDGGDLERVVIRADRAGAVTVDDGPVAAGEDGGPAAGGEDATGEEATSDVAAWATAAGDGPDLVAGIDGEAAGGTPAGADALPVVGAAGDGGSDLVAVTSDHVPPDPVPSDHDAVAGARPVDDGTDDGGGCAPGPPVVAATGEPVAAGAPGGDDVEERTGPVPAAVAAAVDPPVLAVEAHADAAPTAGDGVAAGATDDPVERRAEVGDAADPDLTAVEVRTGAPDRGRAPLPATLFDQDAPEPAPEAEVA